MLLNVSFPYFFFKFETLQTKDVSKFRHSEMDNTQLHYRTINAPFTTQTSPTLKEHVESELKGCAHEHGQNYRRVVPILYVKVSDDGKLDIISPRYTNIEFPFTRTRTCSNFVVIADRKPTKECQFHVNQHG